MNALIYMIFAPIIIGITVYCFKLRSKIFIILFQMSMMFFAIFNFINIKEVGNYYYNIGGWTEGKGIPLYLNTFTASLIVLTTVFFTMFCIYEWGELNKFLMLDFFILIIEGLTIALFASNDLFNIFILMEVTTIIITSLIMMRKNFVSYYDGLIFLLLNILGTSFFLLGIGYMYKIYGVFDLSMLNTLINNQMVDKSVNLMPYVLMNTGILFKLAVFPVSGWLPRGYGSYAAPTVVSAFLAGLYINAAFVEFIKIQEIFRNVIDASPLFIGIGIVTAVVGAFYALVQNDIKRTLAYSTVSQIGIIFIGLNIDNDYARYGSMYQIVSHSVSNVLLFLVAGLLVKRYSTRDITKMDGVGGSMPVVSVALVSGVFGITGAPFFSGSIGKYLIGKGMPSVALELIMYIISFMSILYASKFIHILVGKKQEKKVSKAKTSVLVILSILTFLGGILSPVIMSYIFGYAPKIRVDIYMTRMLIYLVMLFMGYGLYITKLKDAKLLRRIREIDLPFNYMAGFVFVLFMIVYTYCSIVIA